MKAHFVLSIIIILSYSGIYGQKNTHVWQKFEIELEANNEYDNPYNEVDVWIQLKGPDFNKRCYGFWDGNSTWRIRVMATRPGTWTWTSSSNQDDDGLNGKSGSFSAIGWTDAEKKKNPIRRGMIKPTANGHAFRYADGTPMFWLADTWWSCMTKRYFWYEDDTIRTVGKPEAGFKDYVQYRKAQGYNGCMVITAFPNWTRENNDWGGGEWEDEYGNRAFYGDSNSPDLNRLNPAYFQNMDKKVDYLNENGFIPFIETARRDISDYWKNNFGWPESYARYIRYICFRYQGNIIINSPIHLDAMALSGEEWNKAANIIIDRYGWAPFGHQSSANPPGSTFDVFGHTDQARWLTFHSVGNSRDHYLFPSLTKIFYLNEPVPCLNNEPYYDGLKWGNSADQGSDLAAYYSRVALYGSVLSGALAGHVYGADHIWDGDSMMPKAFLIRSASQMQYIYTLLSIEETAYQDLIPAKQLLIPNQTPNKDNNMGWAYCMRTEAKNMFLLYFEKDCKKAILSGTIPNASYIIQWFDPSIGNWVKTEILEPDKNGKLILPDFPEGLNISKKDWAMKLNLIEK
ncbi:DUF4038 domain-containing protein [Bacteroidota bacterium]